jgi:hypothetical protein
VWKWADEDHEGFAARDGRARQIGYHIMADQILAIANDDRNDWSLRRRRDGETEVVLRPRSAALPFAGLTAVESAAAKLRQPAEPDGAAGSAR